MPPAQTPFDLLPRPPAPGGLMAGLALLGKGVMTSCRVAFQGNRKPPPPPPPTLVRNVALRERPAEKRRTGGCRVLKKNSPGPCKKKHLGGEGWSRKVVVALSFPHFLQRSKFLPVQGCFPISPEPVQGL